MKTSAEAARVVATDPLAPPAPEKKGGKRSLDIDRAKGLGIALVVWGHIAGMSTPGMPLWFYVSVTVIYAFHMPFFMYLSGFVFFMIAGQERFWTAPAKQILKRFDRLIIPFLALGILVTIGKYLASSFGPVDDQVSDIGEGVMSIVTNAPSNPSFSVWYLFVLFVYSIITPVLWRLGKQTLILVFLLAVAGWLLPLPNEYYLKRIGVFFIFFAVGGVFAIHRERVLPMLQKWWGPALLVFGASCALMLGSPFALLVCGLLSIPALHGLFLQRFWEGDRLMLALGRNSMAIYLLNTIAIGVTKLLYVRHLPYQDLWFLPFVALVFSAGMIGPMLVRRALGAVPPLAFIKRYLD